jgi:hypothetical protein
MIFKTRDRAPHYFRQVRDDGPSQYYTLSPQQDLRGHLACGEEPSISRGQWR